MDRAPDQPATPPVNNTVERAFRGLARSLGVAAAKEWLRLVGANKPDGADDPPAR